MFMLDQANIAFALLMSTFAGLSTGIGSLIAFFIQKPKKRYLCFSLGLSGGVMIYVSFVEILVKARDELVTVSGEVAAYWYTTAAFFGGILFIAIIDRLIPSVENPHEMHMVEEMEDDKARKNSKLMRVWLSFKISK